MLSSPRWSCGGWGGVSWAGLSVTDIPQEKGSRHAAVIKDFLPLRAVSALSARTGLNFCTTERDD